MMTMHIQLSTCIILLVILNLTSQVQSIGCYVCKSVNGSDPRCEDEFNAYPEAYEDGCTAARKDRTGKFPATWCIKFKARLDNYTVLVRDCTLDNGGTTKDAEIGALDHCGWVRDVRYDNVDMKGCLVVCENDGCNGAYISRSSQPTCIFGPLILVVHWLWDSW